MRVSLFGRAPSFPVVVDVLSLEAPWVLVSLDRLVFNNADEVVTLEIRIDRSRFLEFDAPIGEPSSVDFFPYDAFRQTASIIFDPVDELGANAGTFVAVLSDSLMEPFGLPPHDLTFDLQDTSLTFVDVSRFANQENERYYPEHESPQVLLNFYLVHRSSEGPSTPDFSGAKVVTDIDFELFGNPVQFILTTPLKLYGEEMDFILVYSDGFVRFAKEEDDPYGVSLDPFFCGSTSGIDPLISCILLDHLTGRTISILHSQYERDVGTVKVGTWENGQVLISYEDRMVLGASGTSSFSLTMGPENFGPRIDIRNADVPGEAIVGIRLPELALEHYEDDFYIDNPADLSEAPLSENVKVSKTLSVDKQVTTTEVFVDVGTGSDTENDGTAGLPWASIGHALLQVEGSATPFAPVRINVGPGIYNEQITLGKNISIAGLDEDAENTQIQFFEANETVVLFADNSHLENLTVTTPEPENLAVTLGEARNVQFSCFNVVFDGKSNPASTGLFIVGNGQDDTILRQNEFRGLGSAVLARNASPKIAFNSFENIQDIAVSVTGAGGEIPDSVPLVGGLLEKDTGFNTFSLSGPSRVYIANEANVSTNAKLNNFLFDATLLISEEDVVADGKISPGVDIFPLVSKIIIPNVLVGIVLDSNTGQAIDLSQQPTVIVDEFANVAVGAEGVYLFPQVPVGSFRVAATADGYISQFRFPSRQSAGIVVRENFALLKKAGTGDTTPPNGCSRSTLTESQEVWWGDVALLVLVLLGFSVRHHIRLRIPEGADLES